MAPPAPLCSESPEALGGKPEKDLGKQSGKRTADICIYNDMLYIYILLYIVISFNYIFEHDVACNS